VVVLNIDLGYMKDISESDFLQYFCSKYKSYGFQVLAQPSNAFGLANKMNPSQSVIEIYRAGNDVH
jgi:hypothetical protein